MQLLHICFWISWCYGVCTASNMATNSVRRILRGPPLATIFHKRHRGNLFRMQTTAFGDDEGDMRQTAGHNLRNQGPILEMLKKYIPEAAGSINDIISIRVLEIGAGTGQHAAYMPTHLPNCTWQPTDYDMSLASSVTAWTRSLPNVLPWVFLDVTTPAEDWPLAAGTFDVVYNCNTVHIAPPEVLDGLLKGAARMLRPGGKLIMYGPFKVGGKHTAESNEAFDQNLRSRDPSWGIRDIESVDEKAAAVGMKSVAREDMLANNLLCVWQKD